MLQLEPLVLLGPPMHLGSLLQLEPLMQIEPLMQLEPGGEEVLAQAPHLLVVDKEYRGPAVCCETNTEYRRDSHQYSVHDVDMGRETRLAHLRKRRSKKVPRGFIWGSTQG